MRQVLQLIRHLAQGLWQKAVMWQLCWMIDSATACSISTILHQTVCFHSLKMKPQSLEAEAYSHVSVLMCMHHAAVVVCVDQGKRMRLHTGSRTTFPLHHKPFTYNASRWRQTCTLWYLESPDVQDVFDRQQRIERIDWEFSKLLP